MPPEAKDDDVCVAYDTVKMETELAFLFTIDGDDYWIPKSQLVDHDEDGSEFTIPKWLAAKHELGG